MCAWVLFVLVLGSDSFRRKLRWGERFCYRRGREMRHQIITEQLYALRATPADTLKTGLLFPISEPTRKFGPTPANLPKTNLLFSAAQRITQ